MSAVPNAPTKTSEPDLQEAAPYRPSGQIIAAIVLALRAVERSRDLLTEEVVA